jgi:hypothetical protein
MQDKKEMILSRKIVHASWFAVAVILAFASTVGGDTSILAGWAFLVWTFPFSGLWWFYFYDIARQYLSASVAQPIGSALIIVSAYVFWFVLIPMIWRRARLARK